jgi:drug efflux transport system ATP-binding protein
MRETVIKTEKLSKKFDDFIAVNDLTLDVYKGEIFGFLGANGAGKTTAMKILCGLSAPSGGSAAIAGFDVYRETEQIKKNIGYMSQRFSLYDDLTVTENIRFFGGVYGLSNQQLKQETIQLLEQLSFKDHAQKLVSSLPLGWKQKLSFSIALLHHPKIIFLDEPTGAVDPLTRRQFWDLIYAAAEKGTTIFVTTHYMDEAEYCDRVSVMVDGKMVVLDTPANLKQRFNASSMDDVFYQLARNARQSD